MRAIADPRRPRGLSLCKIHHAAYDQNILVVRPGRSLTVEARQDILDEVDGPMLRYGLQSMAGVELQIPRHAADRPDQTAIAQRYEDFRIAAV